MIQDEKIYKNLEKYLKTEKYFKKNISQKIFHKKYFKRGILS
jgi:hypothetical protein